RAHWARDRAGDAARTSFARKSGDLDGPRRRARPAVRDGQNRADEVAPRSGPDLADHADRPVRGGGGVQLLERIHDGAVLPAQDPLDLERLSRLVLLLADLDG